jgi:hypothetical protein
VLEICGYDQDPSTELRAFLDAHPQLRVSAYRTDNGKLTKYCTALYRATAKGHAACVRMLLDRGADVNARTRYNNQTAVMMACENGNASCLQILLKAKGDVNVKGPYVGSSPVSAACRRGYLPCVQLLLDAKADVNTMIHGASSRGDYELLRLLIDNEADVNAGDKCGMVPVIRACTGRLDKQRLSCLQLLVDNKADLNWRNERGEDVLYSALSARRRKGRTFAFLSCNTDAMNIKIDMHVYDEEDDDDMVTDDKVDACIDEYGSVHDYIDDFHDTLTDTLSTMVEVDIRVGLGEDGIYHEPLERVLEYMGLSMNADQVVNTSIDKDFTRALIPFQLSNALMWHGQWKKEKKLAQLKMKRLELEVRINAGFALLTENSSESDSE